ncbi:MAG: polynucleotide adenylyltransferase [Spirochaetales bacterium]|nr:MAG: polynucleotide adenylyltransferase [Spirochaetales bacterium]
MTLPPVKIPKDLHTAAKIFAEAGYQCWLVGGAVRDGLLNKATEDFDLATDAEPETVTRLFKRTIPTGIKHGTVTILLGKHKFETTTFRRDGKYTDGRRPDSIHYSTDILEDLSRRDFTINAIAWDLINRRLLDPHKGRQDLKKGIIRAIGKPRERLNEDGLRSIRACRLASQLNFRVESRTLEAISGTLENVPGLSIERIWEELKKILRSPSPSTALNLFAQTGLLKIILPELDECRGVTQKGRHTLDVYDHSLAACDAAPAGSPAVRTAALFHDIAKPRVKTTDSRGEVIFHNHDTVGAEMTDSILKRMKASNAERERVVRLVRHHMFHYTSEWTDAAVRRFMNRVGLDILDDLMALRQADAAAIAPGRTPLLTHLEELVERVDGILESETALSIGDLAVNGRDIMSALNIKGGPAVGELLKYLLECVLEDPEVNQREKLLEMARRRIDYYNLNT